MANEEEGDIELEVAVALDTSPLSPLTHWGHPLYCFDEPHAAAAGPVSRHADRGSGLNQDLAALTENGRGGAARSPLWPSSPTYPPLGQGG